MILYLICANVGVFSSPNSAPSSTSSHGTESASTSITRLPSIVVTGSTLTYCSRSSSVLRSLTMSVLISSGTVKPPSGSEPSDIWFMIFVSSSDSLVLRSPHTILFTNARTMSFFFGAFSVPSILWISSSSMRSSMPSRSSSSKSIRISNLSCMSFSSSFAAIASCVFPSFTRLRIAFFLSLISFRSFLASLLMFISSVFCALC